MKKEIASVLNHVAKEERIMKVYAITGVRKPVQLARKLERHGYMTSVWDGVVYAHGDERPWAVLSGYATMCFQVREVGVDKAPKRLRKRIMQLPPAMR
jgi:hypothetical protein